MTQSHRKRAGEALRLKEAGKTLAQIGWALGHASPRGLVGEPGTIVGKERARQLVESGRRLRSNQASMIGAWERRLDASGIDKGHPAWHVFAHARHEWSMLCFDVVHSDLERLTSDPMIATRHFPEIP